MRTLNKFLKNTAFFGGMVVGAALFFACGENTTTEMTTQGENASAGVIAKLSDLPKCTADNEGEQVFVKEDNSVRVCSDGDWYGVKGGGSGDTVIIASECTTAELEDKSGIKILCNGDSVGVVLNGKDGDKGDTGDKGDKGDTGAAGAKGDQGIQGEKGETGETGATGAQGEIGKTGASCTVVTLADNSGLKVLCGGDSVGVVLNGSIGDAFKYSDFTEEQLAALKGETGAGCTAEPLADKSGLKVVCGGDSVGVVLNGSIGDAFKYSDFTEEQLAALKGETGAGCTAEPLADKSGLKVVCGGDSVGVVLNGEKGATGTGTAGASCNLVNKDCVVHVACGKDTVSLEIYSTDESCKETVELDEDAIVTNLEGIGGTSQKGPFLTGSEVVANELLNGTTLSQTGKTFVGKILSDKGDFNIKTVSLSSQYATLTAKGYYLNEVTGKPSNSQITLTALTNLRGRAVANINLLTHLENERAHYLVVLGRKSVAAAKKQAEAEVFNLFHIDSKDFAGYSEDLSVGGTSDADAALLAMSILLQGERSEAELSALLTTISTSMKETGKWDDASTKIAIADWAAGADTAGLLPKFSENVGKWGLSQMVAKFEPFFRNYWYKTLGLEDCTSENVGTVAQPSKGKRSGSSKTRFTCVDSTDANVGLVWRVSTDLEKDTYKWPAASADGKQETGAITGATYVYDAAGAYTKDGNPGWREPKDMLELDTYQWDAGTDGDFRYGSVNTSNCYVFEGSTNAWRTGSADECALGYGGCTAQRECSYNQNGSDYYTCHNGAWLKSDVDNILLNTCGNNPEIGFCKGNVKTSSGYIFDKGVWRVASVGENVAGKLCSDANNGEVLAGSIDPHGTDYGIVCDSHDWKAAERSIDLKINKGCVYDSLGMLAVYDGTRYQCVSVVSGDSAVVAWSDCYYPAYLRSKDVSKNPEIAYGNLVDVRDGSVYKTVKIGNQVWMADDLKYADSIANPYLRGQSICFQDRYFWDSREFCGIGRLYSWTGAMNLDPLYSSAIAVEMVQNNRRGICPEKWHVPDTLDWFELYDYVGESMDNLWSSSMEYDGTVPENPYGFSAKSSGYPDRRKEPNSANKYYGYGLEAKISYLEVDYWTSDEWNAGNGVSFHGRSGSLASRWLKYKSHYFPVRCVRDAPATDEDP